MKRLFPAVCLFSCLIAGHSFAGSATWNLNPTSGDWNTAENWTPATVPNGPVEVAAFSDTSKKEVSLSANTEVDSIVFGAASSAYTITPGPNTTLTISGTGIINDSTSVQSFVPGHDQAENYGVISFINDATAGTKTTFTNESGTVEFGLGGKIEFADNANAGTATFMNSGGTFEDGKGGLISFSGNSSAGNANFTSEGGRGVLASGGTINFLDNSTAGQATLVTKGGIGHLSVGAFTMFWNQSNAGEATLITNGGAFPGETLFFNTSSAGNATLIANGDPSDAYGGSIRMVQSSTGGTARVMVFGKGELNLQSRDIPEVVIGSIEGDGIVTGAVPLVVGSNNLSTTFSGVIQSGSLIKSGAGQLVLTGANTYAGPTRVKRGGLLVNNSSGSATGTGFVQVELGTLGGSGIIAGSVSIGTGIGKRSVLAPGIAGLGTLTIQSTLSFASDGAYSWNLNSNEIEADQVSAQGVTIAAGASFAFHSRGSATIPPDTIFTVIANTGATPISGVFANLADGSMVTFGPNTFQANYSGGDGNDLTLTVVP